MGRADPRGMRVLVTGAAGFIGSQLCDRLLADGHGVWGLDNFDPFYSPETKRRNLAEALGHPGMRLVEGDVRDEILLQGLFSDIPFDLVVHLAARPGNRSSLTEPGPVWDVNVTGTLRLLEAMRRHHVARLIFASSCAVYDGPGASERPSAETEAADRPRSPYAASKRAGELLCHSWHHLWGLSVHCLRLFPVYGPRQRPDVAIDQIARQMLAGERAPVMGGEDDGCDYTYVGDVVETFCRSFGVLAERPSGDPQYGLLNVGRGRKVTFLEVAAALADALDVKLRIKRRGREPGALPPTVADTRAARAVLGFTPGVDLAEGLRETAAWLEETSEPAGELLAGT